ncbi:hypothetical protein ACH492_38320 [Streptomyces sp. NPDC019443]|uniref:hypothetical protein n=1 Tax=Streptomyces sp. NPDC019443 TaxID=3365061 RepID=UPI0037917ABD
MTDIHRQLPEEVRGADLSPRGACLAALLCLANSDRPRRSANVAHRAEVLPETRQAASVRRHVRDGADLPRLKTAPGGDPGVAGTG